MSTESYQVFTVHEPTAFQAVPVVNDLDDKSDHVEGAAGLSAASKCIFTLQVAPVKSVDAWNCNFAAVIVDSAGIVTLVNLKYER
jgi:hypothetical protein